MLANLNDVLLDAKKGKYAVGLFNTVNLEMAKGVIGAAEELHSPVIIGTAEVLTCYSTIDELAYFLIPMAKKAKVPHGRDDFLIQRSDGVFAYQLAVSVDDLDMGITRVVRARDLLDSTPRQIWLMETLGGKAPEYAHAPLLVAPDGRKLSKREGDLNMEALRQKYTPEQLTGKLAKLAGLRQTDAPVTAIDLAADFSWDKVPRADIPIPPDF